VFENLIKKYPCVLKFTICYKPPKEPETTIGQVVSVTNEEGTLTESLGGMARFTPSGDVPGVGSNHWSIMSTEPDLTDGKLLKQFCPSSKFKNK
jgi:hypothetical protein